MNQKETVVVKEGDHREERRSSGWIALVIGIVLLLLFLAFGGLNMFNGQGSGANTSTQTPTTTVPTPATGQ